MVCVAILSAGFLAWRSKSAQREQWREYQTIQNALTAGNAEEALRRFSARRLWVVPENQWLQLELAIVEQIIPPPTHRLANLYTREPGLFEGHEKAAIAAARAMIEARDLSHLKTLRRGWIGKEKDKVAWYQIDTDALILSGKLEQARKVLTSTKLPGEADAERYLRLATLEATNGGAAVLHYLDLAAAADLKSAKVHSVRATVFEQQKQVEKARDEFRAALIAEPENDFYRDQAAEFYRRYGKYDQALEIWSAGLKKKSPKDYLCLKSAFWGRVIRPVDLPLNPPATGDLSALLQFVASMPRGIEWDDEAFSRVPEARRFEQTRQEVFWLRLISALAKGEEDRALALLTYNPFQERSWHPELERALLRELVFRSSGMLKFPLSVNAVVSGPQNFKHPFFEYLDSFTGRKASDLPADLNKLLKSPAAFSAAFLAAGWREAALRLLPAGHLPSETPAWLLYQIGQAKLVNHGAQEALEFIKTQPPSPSLAGLHGEILLAERNPEAAIPLLEKVAAENSEIGERAALALAVAHISERKWDAAEKAIRGNERARASTPGQELLAKISARNIHPAAKATKVSEVRP